MQALLKSAVIVSFAAVSSLAHADGFRCQTLEGDLNVKIYNHTSANAGTRTASVMVVSDPSIQYGNKTIATFSADDSLLDSSRTRFVAKVDLRYNESGRAGENIAGTKLGYLKNIIVDLQYSYAYPVADGARVRGSITFLKRDGSHSSQQLVCARYLKGE